MARKLKKIEIDVPALAGGLELNIQRSLDQKPARENFNDTIVANVSHHAYNTLVERTEAVVAQTIVFHEMMFGAHTPGSNFAESLAIEVFSKLADVLPAASMHAGLSAAISRCVVTGIAAGFNQPPAMNLTPLHALCAQIIMEAKDGLKPGQLLARWGIAKSGLDRAYDAVFGPDTRHPEAMERIGELTAPMPGDIHNRVISEEDSRQPAHPVETLTFLENHLQEQTYRLEDATGLDLQKLPSIDMAQKVLSGGATIGEEHQFRLNAQLLQRDEPMRVPSQLFVTLADQLGVQAKHFCEAAGIPANVFSRAKTGKASSVSLDAESANSFLAHLRSMYLELGYVMDAVLACGQQR